MRGVGVRLGRGWVGGEVAGVAGGQGLGVVGVGLAEPDGVMELVRVGCDEMVWTRCGDTEASDLVRNFGGGFSATRSGACT